MIEKTIQEPGKQRADKFVSNTLFIAETVCIVTQKDYIEIRERGMLVCRVSDLVEIASLRNLLTQWANAKRSREARKVT